MSVSSQGARQAAIKKAARLVRTVPIFGRATEASKVRPAHVVRNEPKETA